MLQQQPMFAYLPALDMKRARGFYEGTFGFTPEREVGGGVFYACAGGTGAFLYPTPNAGTSKASQAYWHVADVEREVAELKARGVVFERVEMPGATSPSGVLTLGGARTAWFKDTEGNTLAVVQTA